MAYKVNENLLDKVRKIFDTYKLKVVVLEQDVECKNGVLLKNSIVLITNSKTEIIDNAVEIQIEMFDCSEPNDLEYDESYKIKDTLVVNVENDNEFINIMESLFAIDDEKSKYQNEYEMLRQEFKCCQEKYSLVCFTANILFKGIGIVLWVFLAILVLLAIVTANLLILSSKSCIGIVCAFASLFVLMPIVKITIEKKFKNKVKDLEESAENIYAKIIC